MQANNDIGPAGEHEAPVALVAEDEVLIRMVLSDHLREAGFHVFEAANGEEARKITGAVGGVDLVISDVHMATPDEGIEFAKWLALHYPEIPVILTSGSRGVAEVVQRGELRNVTDFVPKPCSESEIERIARLRLAARGASSK